MAETTRLCRRKEEGFAREPEKENLKSSLTLPVFVIRKEESFAEEEEKKGFVREEPEKENLKSS